MRNYYHHHYHCHHHCQTCSNNSNSNLWSNPLLLHYKLLLPKRSNFLFLSPVYNSRWLLYYNKTEELEWRQQSLCYLVKEWQERTVGLDRNQKQSRAEEKMLGRNVACLLGNVQQKEVFGGLYEGREGQIMQQTEVQNSRGRYSNRRNQYRRTEAEPEPIAVDGVGRREGYQICFNCRGFRHMAQDCRSRKQEVRERKRINQGGKSSKENRGQ